MSRDVTDTPGDAEDDADEGRFERSRKRLEAEADRAVASFDDGVVDILSWVLDTETRARIYVYLRQHPWSTSGEVAEGTGLYPSTVREALADLTGEEVVHRRKRESQGAGNNPYEYTAIPPSDLVRGAVGQIQDELNTLCNLDTMLSGEREATDATPVKIEVEAADADEPDEDDDGEHVETGERGDADAGERGDESNPKR